MFNGKKQIICIFLFFMSRIGLCRSTRPPPVSLLADNHNSSSSSVSSRRNITHDDINRLKIEKSQLVDEISTLKARIARLEMQTRRTKRTANENARFLTHTDFEYRSVEHLLIQQRAEINELLMSDKAAQTHELKESLKLIYEEQERLKDIQLEKQMEINDAKNEWEEILRTDGPDVYDQQSLILSELNEKLQKFKKANLKLEHKVAKMRDQREIETSLTDESEAPKKQSEKLRRLIREEEKAVKEMDEKIEASIQQHAQIMKQLHIELLQTGLENDNIL